MESIDKLRRHVYDTLTRSAAYSINDMIDEIEREVANMVPLPVDADGVPWHINDEFEVDEGIAHVNGIGDNRLYYIDNDGMQWTRADNKRHHHAPTVEDVLEELLREYDRDDSELTNGEIIERFAAKLQLKEG